MSPTRSSIGRTSLNTLACCALLAFGSASAAFADDRELLRGSVSDPYVFMILDTSGSMHWSPKCTQAQFNAGDCDFVCPTGDCFVPLNGDDPASKFYQAKEALYEVVKNTDNVQFGFATYNQDQANMRAKHYIYRATTTGPAMGSFGSFLPIGTQEVLGLDWSCTSGTQDGCNYDNPADTSDAWEMQRIRRLPKGGIGFTTNITVYVRHGGTRYRIIYDPVSGTLGGATVRFNIDINSCPNSNCNTNVSSSDVDFALVGEFGSWDNGDIRVNPKLGYFNQGEAADPNAANTCSGWDPNVTSGGPNFPSSDSDSFDGYNIRFPTTTDLRGAYFSQGDVVPLDWTETHKQDVLDRLAPNVVGSPAATPDFRTSSYFKNTRNSGEDFLRLKLEAQRPFIASGSTPLGNSVKSFRQWWAGCTSSNCAAGGWEKIAAAQDSSFACRKKFLIVLTDGDESCWPNNGADPCAWTKTLFDQEGIKTYVVAFGVENAAGNKLECMASTGGSGDPIYPQNKGELIQALTAIFDQIREEASAFASAAVPSVQAEVADRIFLSSFTPLNSASVWDGHLDAYLKPLPLTDDGKPNKAKVCPPDGSGQPRSSCLLWDAGEVLIGQAPEIDDLNSSTTLSQTLLKLGMATTQRRVFYSKSPPASGIHQNLALLAPPQTPPLLTDPNWVDLWQAFKIAVNPADLAEAKDTTEDIIKQTLAIKDSVIESVDGSIRPIRYVLGDIFHSDPAIADRPNDFSFYSADIFGNPVATTCINNKGYRCFADRHLRRRKMLLVGSNDSQLHFFDAGTWDSTRRKFTDGTGTEIFSYIPRLTMPLIRDVAQGARQIYGIDATPRIDDVFLDPKHTGTPTDSEREWRTVVVGGFREGGEIDANGGVVSDFVSGYYALDITQPDVLNIDKSPIDGRVVPSCLTTNNTVVSGCGTLPFPAVLWEFTDSVSGSRWDEDTNLAPDLGQTWSVPTVGRIRVIEGTTTTYKFVAIFGGGYDELNKLAPKSGTWLYMVDIETGQAIYKRLLVGAAPSDPAVLDTNLDGFLDTIYIGTTAGFLYKVDISVPAILQTVTLSRNLTMPKLTFDPQVKRISGWNPFRIFNTGGKPIHFAPVAFFVSHLSRFALAFGSGDRENLWNESGLVGRFYLIIDDNFVSTNSALPLTEANFQGINHDASGQAAGTDLINSPPIGLMRGWYLRLPADERVITQAFGLSGVIIFSSYQPKIDIDVEAGSTVCARGGDSSIFVVYANTANAIMNIDNPDADPDDPDDPNKRSRFRRVPEFVTNPFVERGATKNDGDNEEQEDGEEADNSEQLDKTQEEIMETLKQFFPPETKFANYWISVSGIRSDTGYERYATIPIGIIERNWKEQP